MAPHQTSLLCSQPGCNGDAHGITRGWGGLSPITNGSPHHTEGSVPMFWHLVLFPFFYPQLSGFYCKAPNFPLHFPACNNISNLLLLGDSRRLQEEGGL